MIISRSFLTLAVAFAPLASLAAGGGSSTPPTPTETTTTCRDGQVWDEDAQACVMPEKSSLNDAERMDAVRELAYAGQLSEAERVLETVVDQRADAVLTYRGFIARKSGRTHEALDWYMQAISANPNNLLARSYAGQWYVEQGEITLAREELSEIRQRGGRSTWPELSLRMAIQSGATYGY